MTTLYAILGVAQHATQDDIARKYKRLALQFHPDKYKGDVSRFKDIAAAYDVLSDETKRKRYDLSIPCAVQITGRIETFVPQLSKTYLQQHIVCVCKSGVVQPLVYRKTPMEKSYWCV